MISSRRLTRRSLILLSAILVWLCLGSAAFSFSLGHIVAGVIKALAAIGILAAALNPGMYRKLKDRNIPSVTLLVLLLSLLLLFYFEASQLTFGLSALEGARTLPGLIRVGRAVGSFLLGGALAADTVVTAFRRS